MHICKINQKQGCHVDGAKSWFWFSYTPATTGFLFESLVKSYHHQMLLISDCNNINSKKIYCFLIRKMYYDHVGI